MNKIYYFVCVPVAGGKSRKSRGAKWPPLRMRQKVGLEVREKSLLRDTVLLRIEVA